MTNRRINIPAAVYKWSKLQMHAPVRDLFVKTRTRPSITQDLKEPPNISCKRSYWLCFLEEDNKLSLDLVDMTRNRVSSRILQEKLRVRLVCQSLKHLLETSTGNFLSFLIWQLEVTSWISRRIVLVCLWHHISFRLEENLVLNINFIYSLIWHFVETNKHF